VVAYIAHLVAIEGLRAHAAQNLPEDMVPEAFTVMEQLPCTVNGKVDRRALPEPQKEQQNEQTRGAARTSLEQLLTSIWQSLLGVNAIGIHNDFFELGGNSLTGSRSMARLRRALGLH